MENDDNIGEGEIWSKGEKVLLREKRHCIHENDVKKKQDNRETKLTQSSSRIQNVHCNASIEIQLENWRLESHSHPLEIDIRFTHNHVIDSAESLSFWHVKGEVRERFLELFKDGHSLASAIYTYEDEFHITAESDQELLETLANRAINLDYGYVIRLFYEYRNNALRSRNGKKMFERLTEVIDNYNSLGNGRAIMQEYDAQAGKAFILCIMTSLMCRIHKKILQAGELCYVNFSASFNPLNTSITLLYTNCTAGALPLEVLITSDELEITLEKRTTIENEYLVLSTKDIAYFYVVNTAIGTCSCPVKMTGVPCKHQGAVSVKFHISNFNFLPSLTLNDHIVYSYIALETEIDSSNLVAFLDEIKADYESCGLQFRTALDKFAKRYHASKLKSVSFLYDISQNVDPTRVKSDAMIRVQVESVKRRKRIGSSSTKQVSGKENLDPQIIPNRKKRKTGKKEHNLSKNILRNQPN
ncbi:hypothetical protein C1646_750389 [Rhizophagus diaphanus]|nr:hypothetical protein C1646_750389 [Rhizophagus diaphanus] [Rhizophagus sp. MUCL 43196]